jgi:hypothetical protein
LDFGSIGGREHRRMDEGVECKARESRIFPRHSTIVPVLVH